MNVSTANRACSFGAINVLAFSQEAIGELRARCMSKENVENKLNMTREDQIAIASCAYGNRGSSIDFEAGGKMAEERYEKLLQAIDRFNKERRFYEREFKLD